MLEQMRETPISFLSSHNANDFSKHIEALVTRTKMNYIEAVIHYCQRSGIELEAVPGLLTGALKQKIEADGIRLHLLPKTSKLPFSE